MALFDTDPVAERAILQNALANPLTAEDMRAGFFSGSFEAVPHGIFSAGANLALTAGEFGTPALKAAAKPFDETFGTDVQGFLDSQLEDTADVARRARVHAQTYGTAARILDDISRIGTEAVGGFAVGGFPGAILAAGTGEGVPAYRRNIESGLDPQTAERAAALEGAFAAAGVALPMGGSTLLSRLGIGAGSNITLGAAQRYSTGKVLEAGGYPQMATQYKVFDRDAMLADFALGLGMGGVAHGIHRFGEWRDAATTVATARQRDAAGPGIPADPGSAGAHVEAMNAAVDALLNDRPVDVSEHVADTTFARPPEVPGRAAEVDAIAREYGYGPVEPEPARSRGKAVDVDVDSLAVAIAKMGGIDREQARSEWGSVIMDDMAAINRLGGFGRPVLRKTGGRTLDDMASALAERGYLTPDEHGKVDINQLFDALREEQAGNPQFAAGGIEAQMRRLAQERGYADQERAAAMQLPEAAGNLLVADEHGQPVAARDALAAHQVGQLERDQQRRMIEAAATCEGALQ